MSTDKYVPGEGPLGARIAIVGASPSYEEIMVGKPYQGGAGRMLTKLLKDNGIDRTSCWVTNVSKFMVPPNPKGKRIPFHIRAKNVGIDINEQISDLRNELNAVNPNIVLTLGGSALWAFTGKDTIQSHRGSILWGLGRKFIPTYEPAHILHTAGEVKGYWNKQLIDFDIQRCLKQSYFPDYIIPKRSLSIIKHSGHLHQFQEMYKKYNRVAVDIEAGGHCVPICVGLSFDKTHGITVPLWNTDGISNIPDSDMVHCWMVLSEILMGNDIVGQNFNYDRDKIKRLGFTIKRLVSDTMLKAFAINPELPKALAFNQSIYTEEPFYKDEGMYQGKLEDLLIGCARDACVTMEIDQAMDADLDEINQREFYENFLMKLPELYLEIENNGFAVNPKTRDELVAKYVEWDERLRYELWKMTGKPINVNSWKQVKALFEEDMGVMMPGGTGEEEITDLLNRKTFTNQTHRKIAETILEDRRVRKTISTYMLALPDFDGRMKTTCYLCLETGRTSNGQQDPPIRPSVEVIGEDGKKKKKSLGIAFQTITKHGDIGADVRKQYEPDPGYVFVQADSSQAEARIIARLCRDEAMVKMYDDHDVHALTASWFFGGDEAKYSKKVLGYECPERFIGKTLRHGGERGARGKRAMIEVNTQARKYKVNIKITEDDADAALKVFHERTPSIRAVYFNEVTHIVQTTRVLIAPVPFGINARYGGRRMFFERWGDELLRMAYSYLPQRAVTDNTKGAALRIKPRFPGIKLVMESHDALVYMVKEQDVEDFVPIIHEEMERPLDFSNCSLPREPLVIPSEVEIGENLKDFKKYKKKQQEFMMRA